MPVADASVFLRPRLVAESELHKPLPLGAIADLQVCTTAMAEVAKSEFFRRNPRRKRIPQKFMGRFVIRLDYEERDGNRKAAVLLREPHFHKPINAHFSEFLAQHQFADEFNVSRDLVMRAIINAGLDRAIGDITPMAGLRKLKNIGNRLGSTGIVLSSDFEGSVCRIDKDVQRKIRRITTATSHDYIERNGIICAVDLSNHTFKLLTSEKQIIPVKFRNELTPKIRNTFDKFIESRVCIKGTAKLNYAGDILGITSIQSFDEVGGGVLSLDMDSRLSEISLLKAGWFNGEGVEINTVSIDLTRTIFRGLKDLFSIPIPFLYPMPEGGIQAEWTQDQWEITLLLDFESSNAEFFAFDKLNSTVKEMNLPLEDPLDAIDAVAELYNSLLFEGA